MTARWLRKPWTALAVAVLGLGLTLFVAATFAGGTPVRMPDAVTDLHPHCGSCAARNQHVTRLSDAKKTGDLP